jgi:UDP-glucose 4-epimerase
VEDLVTGLTKLMNSDYGLPVNLGNPEEYTVKEFALLVKELVVGSPSAIVHMPATKDDPAKRKPDIQVATDVLGWQPRVPVREGLSKTVAYFRSELEDTVKTATLKWNLRRDKPLFQYGSTPDLFRRQMPNSLTRSCTYMAG